MFSDQRSDNKKRIIIMIILFVHAVQTYGQTDRHTEI